MYLQSLFQYLKDEICKLVTKLMSVNQNTHVPLIYRTEL